MMICVGEESDDEKDAQLVNSRSLYFLDALR